MYTISIAGDATPPWTQLLEAWRLLAAATFPAPALPTVAAAAAQPQPPPPPPFVQFTEWAQSKGLCKCVLPS
jgi:hypothetical protein